MYNNNDEAGNWFLIIFIVSAILYGMAGGTKDYEPRREVCSHFCD